MPNQHIASAFDRDLEAVKAYLVRMGGLVEAALSDATLALETGDTALAEKVRLGDRAIDVLEEEINIECARLIALRQPMGPDLRTALAVMKIAASLERCGDYAKNLGKRVQAMTDMPKLPDAASGLRRMGREVELLLKDALDAFVSEDTAKAEDVRQRDRDVDQMYNASFRELLTHMMEDPRNISVCMHLHFIAKNIERVGDHATAIAEQVIYLSTGAMPDDNRPKVDGIKGQGV
jgi:phosphate transport system protein